MYKLVLIMSGLLLAPLSAGQEKSVKAPVTSAPIAAPFEVNDVVDMLQAKVSEDIIIGMISKASLRFSLSPKEVVALTKAGASDRVLHELDPSIPISKLAESSVAPVEPAPPAPAPVVKPVTKIEADPNDPDAPHRPGLYLYTEKNGQRNMVTINKSVPQSSRAKMSGVLGSALYAFLPRPRAVVRTGDHQPIFYFYVGETAAISSVVDSPGQLALIKMDHQSIQGVEGRRMLYAKVPHIFSNPIWGTDPKAMRLFKFEQKGSQAFRIIPDTELVSGEYCFFFNSGGSFAAKGAAGASLTLWDFGID